MSESERIYCRLCAESWPKEQLICKEDKIAVASKMIIKLLWINIDVSNTNTLPNTICFFCFNQLEKTYTFLHNVRTAQRKLSTIFSRKSNQEIVECNVENMDVIAENVAKPVDEDWESFQVTRNEDQNQTETAPESSSVDSNLSKCNVNVVKQEIHYDDNTSEGECNIIDTEGFNTTNCDLQLQAEVLQLEQIALHIVRSAKHKVPAIFSKKSNKNVDHIIGSMDDIAMNVAKPIKKGFKLFDVPKKIDDKDQIETTPLTSSIVSNLSEYNDNVVKQGIHSDENTPLGNTIDTEGFNTTNRDLPLSGEVMNVEQIAEYYCTIENEDVVAESGANPFKRDWKSFQITTKEVEYENQTETVPELNSIDLNLIKCNTYVKQEIHRDDDPLLCERNIIDTEDIDLQSHLSVKTKEAKKKIPKKKNLKKEKPEKKNLKKKKADKQNLKKKNTKFESEIIEEVEQSKLKEVTWGNYMCCCAECGVQCENITSLRLHSLQTHSCCCVFKCSDCSEVVPSYKHFIRHAYKHKKKLNNYCEFCNKRFNMAASMKRHLNVVHQYDCLTMCPNCGLSFETLDELQNHILTYSKSYKEHNRKEQRKQSDLKCKHCNIEFESLDNLQQHKLIDTECGKDTPCHVCGAKFITEGMLATHMLTHTDTKCEVCSMSFRTRRDLQFHITSIHSSTKPFVCEKCEKAFRSKTRLYLHLRDHRKPKLTRYNCVYCQQKFTKQSNFKRHMQHVHNTTVDDE